MDKKVILAVAGSGKTSHIIDSLKSSDRSLVVTYTENNYRSLRNRIIGEYGCIPDHIRVSTYFSFLYSFCLRPFLADKLNIRGIDWNDPPSYTRNINRTEERYYLGSRRMLYYGRMARLLYRESLLPEVQQRLSTYFDSFFVDEVQDFAGHDFNFLCDIAAANVNILLVGDYYQHTFGTSHDGNVNKNLYKDLVKYKRRFEAKSFDIDNTSLGKSYRCSPTICDFVSQAIGIDIQSHRSDETVLQYLENEAEADSLFHRNDIVKLFYQTHYRYPCFSDNWGASKGVDSYGSVCVVLNEKSDDYYNEERLMSLAPTTKNKLYVACTRSREDLYFVPQKYYTKYKSD